MESRNILLVVICICAFLVIIFGIGFVWSMPDRNNTAAETPRNDGNESGMDIFEHVRDETDPPGLEPTSPPTEQMTLVVGEKKDDTGTAPEDMENNTSKDTTGTETGTEKKNDTIIIRAPKEDEKDLPTTWIAKPQPTPAPAKPTTAPKKKQQVIEYWIQAGSFISRTKADDLIANLAEHGFHGQIKTKEINEVTHFRVRIGPYNNKKEAQKYLDWLKVLNGMKESFISEVYIKKYVN